MSYKIKKFYKISQDLNKDWEEAAKEFGSEPISEEDYLNQVAIEPGFGRDKIIPKTLESNGIKLIKSGPEGAEKFSEGDFVTVFNGVCDGKDCVVKIFNQGEGSMDFDNWRFILDLKAKMPKNISKHIPDIYRLVEINDYKSGYSGVYAIAMERLYPIHPDLKYLIADGWKFRYYSDDLLSNVYKPALIENIYNIINDIYSNHKLIINSSKLSNLESIINEYCYSKNNNVVSINGISNYISINIFNEKKVIFF